MTTTNLPPSSSSSSPSSTSTSRPPVPRPPPNSTPTTNTSRSCKEWLFQCSGRRGSTSSIRSATLPTKLPSKQGPTKPPPPFPRPSTSTSSSTSKPTEPIISHPKLPVNSANHPPSTVPRQPRGVSMTRAAPPSITIHDHHDEYSHNPIETPPSRTSSEMSEYVAAPFSINIIPPTPKHQANKPAQRQMSLSITRSRPPIDEVEE